MWHGFDGMGWWMLWGGLMTVLIWGAIIGLIVWAVRYATGRRVDQPMDAGSADRNPLEIVKGRYARGDINREEFERIKSGLEGS